MPETTILKSLTSGNRWFLLTAVLVALLAAPASAELRSLARADGQVVLAGESVLVFEERTRSLRVRSVPVGGGPAVTVWSVRGAFEEELRFTWVDASAERAAFVVFRDPDDDLEPASISVWSLPPGGPVEVVAAGDPAGRRFPVAVQVDGSTTFVASATDGFRGGWEWVAHLGDGSQMPVRVPAEEVIDLRFSGGLASGPFGLAFDDDSAGAFGVFDWRTGEERLRIAPEDGTGHALRADGTIALEGREGVLTASIADPRRRRLPSRMTPVAFAGDRAVGITVAADRVLALALDGARAHRVGPRATAVAALDGDASGRIAWHADGCVVTALASDPPTDSLPAGVCPRSRAVISEVSPQPILRRRGVPVRLRCVAAPGACVGHARLRGSRPTTFAIPAGERRRVVLRAGRRTRARLRREFRRESGFALVAVRAQTRDPEGRRTRAGAQVGVYRDRRARRCAPTC